MTDLIWGIVYLAGGIGAFLFMRSVKNSSDIANTESLTKKERAYVLLFVVVSPLLAGAVFYYGWIKKFPKKAKLANTWSIIVFIILLGITLSIEGIDRPGDTEYLV